MNLTWIILLFLILPISGHSQLSVPQQTVQKTQEIKQTFTQEQLAEKVISELPKVEEFKMIAQWAKELDIKVYLFGGTAAGFVNFVKNDLQGTKEKHSLYDLSLIYSYNQDLDLLVDGPPEKLVILKEKVLKAFDYKNKGHSLWDIKPLTMGKRPTLIYRGDNSLDYNNDSVSTGLVELTSGEMPWQGRIRDFREWDNVIAPPFLQDLYQGEIHLLMNPRHSTTSRFKEGANPPIFAVIRYLNKALQYGLNFQEQDLLVVKQLVDDFSVREIQDNSPYVKGWFNFTAKKLFTNTQDLERTMQVLEVTGLGAKLQQFGIKEEMGSLAFYMNKKPLPSFPVGSGEGKTAEELGITLVTHATKSIEIVQSITKNPHKNPNFYLSRASQVGENAGYGEGVYAKVGTEHDQDFGSLFITLRLDPAAKEGSDFELLHDKYIYRNNWILIRNKSAIKVELDNLSKNGPQHSLLELLKFELAGPQYSLSNKGRKDIFARWLALAFSKATDADVIQIKKEIINLLEKDINIFPRLLNSGWGKVFSHPNFLDDKLFMQQCEKLVLEKINKIFYFNPKPAISSEDEGLFLIFSEFFPLLTAGLDIDASIMLMEKYNLDKFIVIYLLSQEGINLHKMLPLMHKLLERGKANRELISKTFHLPFWREHPELIQPFILKENDIDVLKNIYNALGEKFFQKNFAVTLEVLRNDKGIDQFTSLVLAKPGWEDHPELIEEMLKIGKWDETIIKSVMSEPSWNKRPDVIRRTIDTLIEKYKGQKDQLIFRGIVNRFLRHPGIGDQAEYLYKILECSSFDPKVFLAISDTLIKDSQRKQHLLDLVHKIVDQKVLSPEQIDKALTALSLRFYTGGGSSDDNNSHIKGSHKLYTFFGYEKPLQTLQTIFDDQYLKKPDLRSHEIYDYILFKLIEKRALSKKGEAGGPVIAASPAAPVVFNKDLCTQFKLGFTNDMLPQRGLPTYTSWNTTWKEKKSDFKFIPNLHSLYPALIYILHQLKK